MNRYQEIQTFYYGLDMPTRTAFDVQGPLPRKKYSEARGIIEELAQHSRQWEEGRDPSRIKKNVSSVETVEEIQAMNAKIDALVRNMKKVDQAILAIQVGCDNCSG